MKILIYGAGVIGSIYASRMYKSGCDVTLLAHGKRYEDLRQNGVIIRDTLTGKQTTSHVPLIQKLGANDFYDLVIVTVRLDQFETVIPILKSNATCPLVMFMLNNPDGVEQLKNAIGGKHVLLGFPGVGGTYQDNFINYIQIKQQETTIGEVNGEPSDKVREIKAIFESAGFKVAISTNMPAWLKTHAVFIACTAAAIIKAGGDSVQLGRSRSSVREMVQSIREGFTACKAPGIPISPANLKMIFMIMPQWFAVLYWQKAMQGEIGTLSIAPHANAAKAEMQLLAKKVLAIVHSSSYSTPTLDNLLTAFIN